MLRTAANADMKFNQFLLAPYISRGSPAEQTLWLDDLTVAKARAAGLQARTQRMPSFESSWNR
jgi:predicted pyridoxine 5'-phosphate oxidase superfamily flavin-nucleotide-binding protein